MRERAALSPSCAASWPVRPSRRRPPRTPTYWYCRYIVAEDEKISEIHVEMDGPESTPYFGGTFRLKLVMNHDFPQVRCGAVHSFIRSCVRPSVCSFVQSIDRSGLFGCHRPPPPPHQPAAHRPPPTAHRPLHRPTTISRLLRAPS